MRIKFFLDNISFWELAFEINLATDLRICIAFTFLGCFNLEWKGDGICDDKNNHGGCDFDGGDCCGKDVDKDLCTLCQCLEEEAPLPNRKY